jgi:peptidase C39-like protein
MPTDLFLAASGWPASVLADVVPPACRRDVEAAPAPRLEGDDAVVELPEWRPRSAALHLVPAFNALHASPASFRFEISVQRADGWSAWVAATTIGEARFAPLGARADGLAAEIDEFVAEAPAPVVRVRLRVRADDRRAFFGAPWLVSLSAWDGRLPSPSSARSHGAARLAVPALSQMEADEAIRMRICSPASVAMVLAYWGEHVEVASLAREIFHPALDRYGVWPAAIRAAGRHGVASYLLRFPDWASAAWCLERGLPVIASVRYGAGELAGAAIPETSGHLLVLTGYAGDEVLVNDPAATTAASVARRYRLDQLCRVWLERAGVGYVLVRLSTSPSGRSPRP